MDDLRIQTPRKKGPQDEGAARGPRRYATSAPVNAIAERLKRLSGNKVKSDAKVREEANIGGPSSSKPGSPESKSKYPTPTAIPRKYSLPIMVSNEQATTELGIPLEAAMKKNDQPLISWDEDSPRRSFSEYGRTYSSIHPMRLIQQPPILFDPVEDRIRSRWLPALALCLIPTVFSTVFFVDFWDNSAAYTTDAVPSRIG